jgi:hypothetical protein
VRNEVKKHLSVVNNEKWCEHVKSLSVQGNFFAMAAAEKTRYSMEVKRVQFKTGYPEVSPTRLNRHITYCC